MKVIVRGLGIVFGVLGILLEAFDMPSLDHTPIGSRCGGCRYDGPYIGEAEDERPAPVRLPARRLS